MPFSKELLLLIALMPMSLQQAASLSQDSFTNAIAFLFVAYCFKIAYNIEKCSVKDKIILFGLAVIISLCKIVYLPLILLYFLIPHDRMESKKLLYLYLHYNFYMYVS